MQLALGIRPGDPGLKLLLAQSLVLAKDFDAAADLMPECVLIVRMVAASGPRVSGCIPAVSSLTRTPVFHKPHTHTCSILKTLKDDADAHLLQGAIYEARGQLLEAIQSYDIAMGLDTMSTRPIISSGGAGQHLLRAPRRVSPFPLSALPLSCPRLPFASFQRSFLASLAW